MSFYVRSMRSRRTIQSRTRFLYTTIALCLFGLALLMTFAAPAEAQSTAPQPTTPLQPGMPAIIPKPLQDVLQKVLPKNTIPNILPGQSPQQTTQATIEVAPQARRQVAEPRDKLQPVPPLQGHVNDLVGMLQPDQRNTLESVLSDYETRTGSQIALLLVNDTEPEVINDFGLRVTDAWKLGRKGVDDGVLLLVAKNNSQGNRRMVIMSGRGVQGVLTDAMSKRVLQDVIAPHFQRNDFYGGLTAGTTAITTILDQQTLPAAQRKQQDAEAGSTFEALAPLLFFGFMILMMIISRKRNGANGGGRGSLNSNVWGNAAGVVLGTILSQAGRGGGGGFGGGGFGGGGGGGGFGGGGGGFDGGGASGDW